MITTLRDQVIRHAERDARELATNLRRMAVLYVPGEPDRVLTDAELAAVRNALGAARALPAGSPR